MSRLLLALAVLLSLTATPATASPATLPADTTVGATMTVPVRMPTVDPLVHDGGFSWVEHHDGDAEPMSGDRRLAPVGAVVVAGAMTDA